MAVMAYGDGTLFRRASGKWVKRFRGPDGKWHEISFPKKPTRDQVTAKIGEWSNASANPPPTESVGEFLGRWLRDGLTHNRGRTVIEYRRLVTRSIIPSLGHLTLADLRTPDVQRWVNAGATRHAVAVLRAALSEAVRWGLIPVNPARGVRLPPREHIERATLSAEQTRTLLAQVNGDALFTLAIYTGMRQGELLGLRWQDVDLKAGTLTVARSLWWQPVRNPEPGKRRRVPVLTEPKTARSRRRIDLPVAVVTALTEHRRTSLLNSKDGLVFTRPDGHALEPSSVYTALHRHLKAVGLPEIRFHDLRHGTASLLLESGWDVAAVSELLGHSSAYTTLTTYSHTLDQRRRATAERMGMLLEATSVAKPA